MPPPREALGDGSSDRPRTAATPGERDLDRRLRRIPLSLLHRSHRLGRSLALEGRRPMRLDVGEPAFRAPQAACDALTEAMARGDTSYSPVDGIPELRDGLVRRLRTECLVDATPQRMLVTPGSSFAITAILLGVCDPGDEVLLPEVSWPIYAQAAAIAGVAVRTYPLGPDFALEPDRIAAAATDRTRLVVVNSPANPTGAVGTPDALEAIAAWGRERGVWLLGDEAYEHFVYDGEQVALASFERDVDPAHRRVFSVHTFSKAYGMTGYRMGYAAAPNDTAARLVQRVAEGTIIAPSTPVQYAAAAALADTRAPVRAATHVRTVRDGALAGAVEAGMLPALVPAGWYAMVDISSTGCGSLEFCDRLLETRDVIAAPGVAFVAAGADDPHWVRVAFCGDHDEAVEGMDRLVDFAVGLAERRATRVTTGSG